MVDRPQQPAQADQHGDLWQDDAWQCVRCQVWFVGTPTLSIEADDGAECEACAQVSLNDPQHWSQG